MPKVRYILIRVRGCFEIRGPSKSPLYPNSGMREFRRCLPVGWILALKYDSVAC